MTPKQIRKYYKNTCRFHEATGMSSSTLLNWIEWGYVPLKAQVKLETLTNGDLKAEWHRDIKKIRKV